MPARANGKFTPQGNGASSESKLGSRIREGRMRRGLTVAELGARAGVSKSLVSQIERGVAMPSVETIRRIASSLDMPVFSLFLDDLDSDMVVRSTERRRISYPGSEVAREILSPGLHGRMVMLWVTFPPGEASGPMPVHHRGEECIVVIEGVVDVLMAEEKVRLEVGDSMTFDAEVPHRFHNPTAGVSRAVVAISPPNI
jgi:transcriptional regulator with XRE-family HTH domain